MSLFLRNHNSCGRQVNLRANYYTNITVFDSGNGLPGGNNIHFRYLWNFRALILVLIFVFSRGYQSPPPELRGKYLNPAFSSSWLIPEAHGHMNM